MRPFGAEDGQVASSAGTPAEGLGHVAHLDDQIARIAGRPRPSWRAARAGRDRWRRAATRSRGPHRHGRGRRGLRGHAPSSIGTAGLPGADPPARIGSVSLVRVFVLGIDPGLSGAATACSSGPGAPARAVAIGVLTTPPSRPVPERLAELQARARGPDRRVPADGRGRRAGVLPGQRAHGDERRAGQRPRPGRGRRPRLRGRAVHAQPGQGRGRRLGRRRQGAGAADGADAARAGHAAQAGRRRRRRRAGALPPGHRRPLQARHVADAPRQAGDDRLAARHGARTSGRRRGAPRGRRRRLPRHRHAHAPLAELGAWRRRCSSTSTTTSARTPRRSTASCTRDERRLLRDPHRPPTASARRSRSPSSPCTRPTRCSTSSPTTTSARSASCPASARRPPSGCWSSSKSGLDRARARRSARPPPTDRPLRRPRAADVREALAGLGYGPTRCRGACASCPTAGDAAELLRDALQRLAVG